MKLSTKKNRFPHTFSKARALECNYSVNVTRPCPASSAQGASASGKVEWVYGNETRSLSRFHVGCKANTDSESPARTGFKGHRMTLQTSE